MNAFLNFFVLPLSAVRAYTRDVSDGKVMDYGSKESVRRTT
jgi:hypothetical protein